MTHEHDIDPKIAEDLRELVATALDVGVGVVVGEGEDGVVEHHDLPVDVRVGGDRLLHERLVVAGVHVVGVDVHEQNAVVHVPVIAGLGAGAAGGAERADVGNVEVVGVPGAAVVVITHGQGLGEGGELLRGEVAVVLTVLFRALVVDLVTGRHHEVRGELVHGVGERRLPTSLVGIGIAARADLRVAGEQEAEGGAGAEVARREDGGVGPGVVVADAIDVGGVGGKTAHRGLIGHKALTGGGRLQRLDLLGAGLREGVALLVAGGRGDLDERSVRGGAEPVEVTGGLGGADLQGGVLHGVGGLAVGEGDVLHVQVDIGAGGAPVVELDAQDVAGGLEAQARDIGEVEGRRLGSAVVGATVVGGAVNRIGAVLHVVVELGDDVPVYGHDGGVVVGDLTGDGLDGVDVLGVEGGAEVIHRDGVAIGAVDVLVQQHLGRHAATQVGDLPVLGAKAAGGRLPGGVAHRGARLPAVSRLLVVVAILPLRLAGFDDLSAVRIGDAGRRVGEQHAAGHEHREHRQGGGEGAVPARPTTRCRVLPCHHLSPIMFGPYSAAYPALRWDDRSRMFRVTHRRVSCG